jgi:hypothetical protein
MKIAGTTFLLFLVSGCVSNGSAVSQSDDQQNETLPTSNVTVNIPGLGPCSDSENRTLRLEPNSPLHILVHGCFGSSGQFRGLAQVLAFHGQQAACFTYDDRAALTDSATKLRQAIDRLQQQAGLSQVTVMGHSQGALVARKALTEVPPGQALKRSETRTADPEQFDLVTISGPFSGIAAAKTCGRTWLYPLTLGLLPVSCYIATGAKWTDITFSSHFIREPGVLVPEVRVHLKIDTDESGICRHQEDKRCLEYDDVFSLAEQRNALIENDPRVRRVELRAGHVEIVGNKKVAPLKLIATLQEHGILRPTRADQSQEFGRLLARVFQRDSTVGQRYREVMEVPSHSEVNRP